LVEGDGPAVICFPGIGGNPLSFGELLKSIDLGRTFEGVQLPGAMGASKPIRSVEELADYFMEQVRIDNGQAPDMMAYSFGAGVMMEMASRWEARGVKPGKIVIVDGHLMCGLRPKRGLGRLLAHAGAVRYLGWRGGAEYVVRRVLGKDAKRATPRVFEQDESLAHIAELVAVNRKAMMAYRPTGSYSGEVLLIRASKPDWLRFMQDDGFNGWGDMIRGPIETVPVVASHQHVLKEPAVSVFALRVKAWLSHPMDELAH
jgi:thioesterase domain-containing protein